MTDSSRLDSARETPPGNFSLNTSSDPIAYSCNRGVGARLFNGSTVCFCPPQYYGENCQYHAHRIIVSFHLNLSQSIYSVYSDIQIVLKLLVLFLYDEEVVGNHVFHVRPSAEMSVYSKKSIYFTYPFLSPAHHPRPWQNSSLHPYSVRIETYERMNSGEPYLVAVWQYSIQFDFLPVYRFSKVLHLTEPLFCPISNPCNPHQDCHRLMNDPSQLICLCKSNRTGENCSFEDTLCIDEYCASQSLCKPKYRGLLTGNHYPYCICSFNRFGERCDVVHDRCTMTPCQNNGSCFSMSKPDVVACQCPEGYLGKFCEMRSPLVKIMIPEIEQHQAVVIEYLKIDSLSLNLILLHQRVFRTLPSLHTYQPGERLAPEIILVKLYFSSLEKAGRIHLLAIHLRANSIAGTGQLTEQNHCRYIRVLVARDLSPIQYHSLCQNFSELLCFHDDYYLCICSNNHSRVECFHYDGNLDHCSRCLAGGRCLQGDQMDPNDFLCLCPTCYSGVYCQFNLNSFTFTLDQLFFTDLLSMQSQYRTKQLLIVIPLLLFILSLPNNYFSFVTFHRSSCLSHGVGHYLRHMSIINPLNLAILAIRMIHLALDITGVRSSSFALDNVLCKILSFLLTSSSRMVYWLSSLVAIERIYMTLFLNGRWLKKPHMARRLIIVVLLVVAVSDLHELFFIQSLFGIKDGRGSMCVFQFPVVSRSQWQAFHLILAVFHSIVPLIINLCSMITVNCVVIRKKIKTRAYFSKVSSEVIISDDLFRKSINKENKRWYINSQRTK